MIPSDTALLNLYFRKHLTQQQIAKRYGLYQMQVSRLIAKAVQKRQCTRCGLPQGDIKHKTCQSCRIERKGNHVPMHPAPRGEASYSLTMERGDLRHDLNSRSTWEILEDWNYHYVPLQNPMTKRRNREIHAYRR